jgi:hypothetical protein
VDAELSDAGPRAGLAPRIAALRARLDARRPVLALALPALIVVVATGCGGSDKPSVCEKRDDVKSSVDQLLKVNPADGLEGVNTQLVAVQASVQDLASAAGSEYQPQISALQSSLKTLSTQVQSLTGNPSAAALASFASAVQQVKTSLTALTDAVASACD